MKFKIKTQIQYEDPLKRRLARNRIWSYAITSLIKNWKDHYLSKEIKQRVVEVRGRRLLQFDDWSFHKISLLIRVKLHRTVSQVQSVLYVCVCPYYVDSGKKV